MGLALALGLALPSGALAADNISVDLGNGGSAAYDGKGNLTVGNQATAEGSKNQGQYNTAIGTNADTLRNVTDGETTQKGQPLDTDANKKLVDREGQAQKLDISTESGGSRAVGYNNKAEGDNSTALGNTAKIINKPVVYYADADSNKTEGDNSTALGNTAKIINKPVVYYADADSNKTASADNAAWYKDASGNPTKVPRVFRDANGNTTTTPQYKYTHTVTAEEGTTSTVTDITSDISKANKDSNNNPRKVCWWSKNIPKKKLWKKPSITCEKWGCWKRRISIPVSCPEDSSSVLGLHGRWHWIPR